MVTRKPVEEKMWVTIIEDPNVSPMKITQKKGDAEWMKAIEEMYRPEGMDKTNLRGFVNRLYKKNCGIGEYTLKDGLRTGILGNPPMTGECLELITLIDGKMNFGVHYNNKREIDCLVLSGREKDGPIAREFFNLKALKGEPTGLLMLDRLQQIDNRVRSAGFGGFRNLDQLRDYLKEGIERN